MAEKPQPGAETKMNLRTGGVFAGLSDEDVAVFQEIRYLEGGEYTARSSEILQIMKDMRVVEVVITKDRVIGVLEGDITIESLRDAKEERKPEQEIKEFIDGQRDKIKKANQLFLKLQTQIQTFVEQNQNIDAMTAEARSKELDLYDADTNSYFKEFISIIENIEFGIDGRLGELYKELHPKKPEEGDDYKKPTNHPGASKDFAELHFICQHDLEAVKAAAGHFGHGFQDGIKELKSREKVSDADIVWARKIWRALHQGWEQGILLQEDFQIRTKSKDHISAEDIETVKPLEIFEVFKRGVVNLMEKNSKQGEFNIDPNIKDLEAKINPGALYFILRNIANNPIRRQRIGASKIDINIFLSDDKKEIVVKVEDNGYGIEPDRINGLSVPGDTGATDKEDGSGLGMAYSGTRLADMKSSIDIITERNLPVPEDDTKHGTTMLVSIPVES